MTKNIPNEIELLKASLRGQTPAFEVIVQKYQSLICAITYSATGSVEQSEELAQQAFIKCWKNLGQLKDLAKFRAWLCSITRNLVNDSYRRQKNEITSKAIPMDSIQDHRSEDIGPVEAAISKEREAIVNEALSKIPETFREPLVLYYREDRSYRQVADQLGFSEHTARERISEARKLLKEKVASLVEETIERTKPGKVFTTAVIASIAGLGIKGSGVAAAAGIVAGMSKVGTATSVATVMSGIAAKIITAAAVVAIGVGAVVTYKHITKPKPEPQSNQTAMVVQEQGDERDQTAEAVIEQPSNETASLLVFDKSQSGLETGKSVITTPQPVSTKEIEFRFAPKGILSGLITDAETDEPIIDAKVYATHKHGGRIYESGTDANGFYCFKDIKQEGDYGIQIFQKKYIGIDYRDTVTIHLEEENQRVKHFQLQQRACMIEIKVRNEQGEPLSGTYFINTLLADKDKREIGDPIHSEKTDANGTIILGGFKPTDTPYLIVARHRVWGDLVQRKGMRYYQTHRDYAPSKLEIMLTDPNIVESREIILAKGISIAGYIEYLDGEPATDLEISAYPTWWHSHHCPESYAVDANGYFTLEHILPGTYEIHAFVPLSDDSSRGTSLGYRELPLADGELVELRFPGLNNNWVRFEHPEGEFELASKGKECKRVSVRADGFAMKLSDEICPDANEPTLIKLGIGGAIEGKVVNEKGNPVEDAKISYRYRRSRGEKPDDKYITATDVNGIFIIEDVPESDIWQWFVISHPNYAPEIKHIEIEQDYIADVKIVLKKGGAVEGYVYDSKGKPMPDTTLYFLDETSYSYWEENRGRLGSVTTDSNGFYRIMGMPEKLCFGFRQDPDKQLGIVRTSILPKKERTSRLDFGGQWYATGRLLQDGRPMANIKVMVQGNVPGHETAFTAYALTDAEGRFTFWGIPSGRRYVYWSIPGLRSWEQWSEIGRFNFESGIDMDMGDFNLDLAEVVIEVVPENPDESLNQLDIYIQRYNEKRFYGSKAGQLLSRVEPSDPYIFRNMAPGIYEVIARRPGYPTIHKVFEIEQDQKKCDVDLWIPTGFASLSGKIIPSDPKQLQRPLILRSISQEITMGIQPAADGSYEIWNLPAGDYIIGRASVALSRQSLIKEVSLKSGENKKLDIEVDSIGREYGGYLVIVVVTEEGLPLAGANVWLEKGGNIIEPHFDSDKSKSFAGDAGEHMLFAEYPGYRKVQQRVNIKPKEGLSTQEILKPLVITMSK